MNVRPFVTHYIVTIYSQCFPYKYYHDGPAAVSCDFVFMFVDQLREGKGRAWLSGLEGMKTRTRTTTEGGKGRARLSGLEGTRTQTRISAGGGRGGHGLMPWKGRTRT